MKTILAALVIFLIHCGSATLVLRGPTGPVLESESVSLECLLKDSEYNIEDVRFEYFNKFKKEWTVMTEHYSWCYRAWWYHNVHHTGDRTNLTVYMSSYKNGVTFRCLIPGTNATSETLNFTVHYMRSPQFSTDGITSYFSFPRTLRVRAGDDVVVNCSVDSSEEPNIFWSKEGSDWILPSSVLTLKKVSAFDEGQYTCAAQHPTILSFSETRSFNLTVLSEQAPWYQTSDGLFFLMILTPATTCLLVVIIGVSMFLCHRAKKIRTSKGPIDDHSQKKPIYKSSSEPLPITCGDNKPLLV